MIKIGIIGGSGLDKPDLFKETKVINLTTPFGQPSSLRSGQVGQTEVVILVRHGNKHTIPPTQINYRANIFALKKLGCTHILATTAVGSLKEQIKPGDFVIIDQFIDFTRKRLNTYYQKFAPHKPTHTPMAEPFSKELRKILIDTCSELKIPYHKNGTVITIEGPRFSTKAESHLFRSWGADIINMSIATEASLANEIGIPYAAIAMSTDYDCWKESEESVSWEMILKTFEKNVNNVTDILISTLPKIKSNPKVNKIKNSIRTVPDWPKQGIMFRDITTLLKDEKAFRSLIDLLYTRYVDFDIDKIVGIESRGFIIGSALAYRLGLGFIPIRKKGKLPAKTISQEYDLEYGKDTVEIHQDAIAKDEKVLLIDDLIATGGTALASVKLIQKLKGEIVECCFVIDLPNLKGTIRLKNKGLKIFSLMNFSGE